MKYFLVITISLLFCCRYHSENKIIAPKIINEETKTDTESYETIKDSIAINRKEFYQKYHLVTKGEDEITTIWISSIGTTLYSKWEHTPWDYNGTTSKPHEGAIACGYFVTTLLRDMGCNINRSQLATCASSVMMKNLAPDQKLRNLSSLSYPAFNDAIIKWGKGVYIIGLDYHTGFIVNDGAENWFIHSNYMYRQGVVKERVLNSANLKASKTRWMICLTQDAGFVNTWLAGK